GFEAAAIQHIMADDARIEEEVTVVAGDIVEVSGGFDPVVAFIAKQDVGAVTAEHKVIPGAAAYFAAVRAGHQKVLARPAEDQGHAAAAMDDIIAFVAVEHVHFTDIRSRIGDDVVALATMYAVHAVSRFDAVISLAAPDCVVSLAGNDVVITIGSHD